eukprot:11492499-Prorocentrum_lima.AAC.1
MESTPRSRAPLPFVFGVHGCFFSSRDLALTALAEADAAPAAKALPAAEGMARPPFRMGCSFALLR